MFTRAIHTRLLTSHCVGFSTSALVGVIAAENEEVAEPNGAGHLGVKKIK
jgi:hypothetical protein